MLLVTYFMLCVMSMPVSLINGSLFAEPTSVSQKPAVKHIQYQGLYEFEPRNPDELGINEGDIIKVC